MRVEATPPPPPCEVVSTHIQSGLKMEDVGVHRHGVQAVQYGAGLACEDEDPHTLLAYSQPFHSPSLHTSGLVTAISLAFLTHFWPSHSHFTRLPYTLLAYSQPFHSPSLPKTSCHCKSCSMDLCCMSNIVECDLYVSACHLLARLLSLSTPCTAT